MMHSFKGLFSIVFLITLNRSNPSEMGSDIIKVLILLNSLVSDMPEQKHLYIGIFEAFS